MYEKRRDWEKLLGLQRREAERLGPGPERAAKFLEIAKLATERVKKPEICIELWQEVLSSDESNAEALGALAGLYERAKDFEKLASVLERQAESTFDAPAKIQVLTKLGTIYGERLNNDEGAVNAWRALLTLDPNDRRAQDALKKKYLALGRWDDLEVFYAETGKWDEFIRVLEQQEAKETNTEAKISLLFKIAQLWADKKQKLDRAAKAYEKVLELEPENLQAAEALIPIYSAAGNAKALANAIEVKLAHEGDLTSKLELFRDVAALYEGKVRDPQKAFERYLAAFELAPADPRTSEDVERAAAATSRWDEVVAVVQTGDRGSRLQPRGATSRVMLRLSFGRVLVDSLQRIDDALDVYRAVYEADGENVEAIGALERLYRQTGRFADLLGIYEKKRDLVASRPKKERRSTTRSRVSTRTRSATSTRPSRRMSGVLEDEPRDRARARRARRALRPARAMGAVRRRLRRRIELDVERERSSSISSIASAQTLEKHLERSGAERWRTTARSSSSTRSTRARRRRWRRCSRGAPCGGGVDPRSRSTRSAATGRS